MLDVLVTAAVTDELLVKVAELMVNVELVEVTTGAS